MNKDKILATYKEIMEDIKSRYDWIIDYTRIPKNTENREINKIDIECIALQARKILENIAFATMVSNIEQYSKVRKNFETDWNGKRIIKEIEKFNADFYPEPMTLKKVKNGYFHCFKIKEENLNKHQWCDSYDFLSGLIHQSNPFGIYNLDPMEIFIKINKSMNKVVALLNSHKSQLENGDYVYCVMNVENTQKVCVMYLEKGKNQHLCALSLFDNVS